MIGTGYAAKARTGALETDSRARTIAVAGRDDCRSAQFAQAHGLRAMRSWQALAADDSVDLVVIATVSALHGEIAEAALKAGKHVVVEYPLSFDVMQAERLVDLAARRGLLLHVEHIELLGGLHRAMRAGLDNVGEARYVSYRTLNPQNPAPRKWTYRRALFGFAYFGALSRVQRMVNLFGAVRRVSCCTQYLGDDEFGKDWFRGVMSSARLEFECGVVAELTYGKGEGLWIRRRDVEIQGRRGAIAFTGNQGKLVTAEGAQIIAVEPRKGLFVKDTDAVLGHLTEGTSLYVSAAESLYALRVADALRRASESGQTVEMEGSASSMLTDER